MFARERRLYGREMAAAASPSTMPGFAGLAEAGAGLAAWIAGPAGGLARVAGLSAGSAAGFTAGLLAGLLGTAGKYTMF